MLPSFAFFLLSWELSFQRKGNGDTNIWLWTIRNHILWKIHLTARRTIQRKKLSKWSTFFLTTSLSSLVVRSSNRLLGYLWEQTVPLFWLTCSCFHTKRNSSKSWSNLVKKNLAKAFNFTFRYIDDVLSLNNKKFIDYVHRIYPSELEIFYICRLPRHFLTKKSTGTAFH